MTPDDERFSLPALLTTPRGHLALALLAVELIAGMQTFLLGTVTPLLAADLHGRELYGVVTAASQVAIFLTMPLGASLMHRFSPSTLLTWLTPVTVLAGVIGALSPTMWVFVASRVLAGLAAGVLATVGMGAIVTGLPPSWRQVILAANNLMWLFSAVVGPMYAAWVSHALSWRWAMVLYLPFLVLARWVIARQLGRQGAPARPEAKSKLPLLPAVALAAGIAGLSATALHSPLGWLLGALGLAVIVPSLVHLLPAGVATLRPGARAAIGLLGLLSLLVFSVDSVAAILAHDVLGFDEVWIGWLLTSMSFFWSLVGLACGRWPAAGRSFLRRGGLGVVLLGAGALLMAWALAARQHAGFIAGFSVLGTGMGLVFLDAMNVAFTPEAADPLPPTDAASAATLAQQVVGASGMTIATTLVAIDPTWGPGVLAGLGLVALPAMLALRRAAA